MPTYNPNTTPIREAIHSCGLTFERRETSNFYTLFDGEREVFYGCGEDVFAFLRENYGLTEAK